jgi:general secretion pathway protein E
VTPTLPLAFARRHGLLLTGTDGEFAQIAIRPDVVPSAIAEARRHLGMPLHLRKVAADEFDALLRLAYEAGSDARTAAGGLDDTTDLAFLAQDLPEQSDLLDSEDDAPIIRLINALLTQAIKENASDIHIDCALMACCARSCKPNARWQQPSSRASR